MSDRCECAPGTSAGCTLHGPDAQYRELERLRAENKRLREFEGIGTQETVDRVLRLLEERDELRVRVGRLKGELARVSHEQEASDGA